MKRFMMFSVSVLCLAVAVLIGFYVGSQRAEAQAPADTQYFYQVPRLVILVCNVLAEWRCLLRNSSIWWYME